MIQKTYLKLFLCILLLAVVSGPCFPTDVEFPLMQSFCYFPYSDNTLPGPGTFTLGVDLYYSNVFMHNHYRTIINDFETFSASAGIRYGFGKHLAFELYVRYASVFGGKLDKFIENFHSFFGLPDAGRDEFPRNRVNYILGNSIYYWDTKSAASPLILAVLKDLGRIGGFSFKTRLALGIPLSKIPGFSSDRPFLSAGLISNYSKNKFDVQWSNYITLMKEPSWLAGEDIRRQMIFSRLEIRWSRLILGLMYKSSMFKEDDISHGAYQGYIGYKVSKVLDFLIIEDFHPFDTTPDISFSLRFKLSNIKF
ncbi:MAG: DUF3187 family protein [bacterium]|nr:DUF3187 family protein [bacterium]